MIRKFACSLLLLAAPLAVAAPLTLEQQLARLLEWFPGEYDNNEQHWQQATVDQVAEPIERIHHIFAPVAAPKVGPHAFFVQQYLDGDPAKVYRRRLYTFAANPERDAVQLTIYNFQDEAAFADAHLRPAQFAALEPSQLKTTPGCEVYWRWNGSDFDGEMDRDACRIVSQRMGGKTLIINDTLRLTADQIWISDTATDAEGNHVFGNKDGVPHKNRKVSYYDGWIAVKAAGRAAAADNEDWLGQRGLSLHNEGQRVAVLDRDGKPMGYTVELARLTYQNTRTPIMTLKLLDDATGKSVSYSWAGTDSDRVGINLGWFQAGFTRKPARPHFGFPEDGAP